MADEVGLALPAAWVGAAQVLQAQQLAERVDGDLELGGEIVEVAIELVGEAEQLVAMVVEEGTEWVDAVRALRGPSAQLGDKEIVQDAAIGAGGAAQSEDVLAEPIGQDGGAEVAAEGEVVPQPAVEVLDKGTGADGAAGQFANGLIDFMELPSSQLISGKRLVAEHLQPAVVEEELEEVQVVASTAANAPSAPAKAPPNFSPAKPTRTKKLAPRRARSGCARERSVTQKDAVLNQAKKKSIHFPFAPKISGRRGRSARRFSI